jgi:ribonuclease VapC
MIVVDSSALIAILFDEPEKQAFENIVAGDERCVMSAVNVHETAIVLRVRHGPQAVARLWQLLTDSEIEIVPFDEMQVHIPAIAFDRYGKVSELIPCPSSRRFCHQAAAFISCASVVDPWR